MRRREECQRKERRGEKRVHIYPPKKMTKKKKREKGERVFPRKKKKEERECPRKRRVVKSACLSVPLLRLLT